MKPHKISTHSACSKKALFTDPIFSDGFDLPIRLAKVCCSQCLPRFIFLGQNLNVFIPFTYLFSPSLFLVLYVRAKPVLYLLHLDDLFCKMYRMVTM